MSVYFADSSVLVKRYIQETGTTWVRSLTLKSAGNEIFVAVITQSEIFSAASRQLREGKINSRTLQAIRLQLSRHLRREYNLVPLTTPINERTQDLLQRYPLRASDAIQLTTAIELQTRVSTTALSSITFLSADTRLLSVAQVEGLVSDDPNLH